MPGIRVNRGEQPLPTYCLVTTIQPGVLPLTYYKSLDELPAFDDYDITKGRTYKYFKGDVLYPFGYGLSYSSFKYSDLKVKDGANTVSVSFRLKNTGQEERG